MEAVLTYDLSMVLCRSLASAGLRQLRLLELLPSFLVVACKHSMIIAAVVLLLLSATWSLLGPILAATPENCFSEHSGLSPKEILPVDTT